MNSLLIFSRPLSATLVALTLCGALAGCAPVVLGGVAMGSMLAVDRRTTGIQIEDEGIELRALNRIQTQFGERVHVNVTSYNRQVLLTGEVPSDADRQAINQIVAGLDNARSVVNELAVMPITTLSQRSNDTFITGKVRASLVDADDLPAGAFKVVTERGVVYLLGRVTQREAARATSIARGVGGVVKVIRVFEYLTEEDLVRLSGGRTVQNQPNPAPAGP